MDMLRRFISRRIIIIIIIIKSCMICPMVPFPVTLSDP